MSRSTSLGKKPTACIPCHQRKVRCDSPVVGVPCTRCVSKDRVDACALFPHGGSLSAYTNNANKELDTVIENNVDVAVDDIFSASLDNPAGQRSGPSDNLQDSNLVDDAVNYSVYQPAAEFAANQPNHSHKRKRTLEHDIRLGLAPDPSPPISSNGHLSVGVARALSTTDHIHEQTSSWTTAPAPQATDSATSQNRGSLSTVASEVPQSGGSHYMVSEDDAHLQTLDLMSTEGPAVHSWISLSSSDQGQRVIEYYGELNSITVLGEVLGRSRRRLIRIDIPGPPAVGARQRELSRLEPADRDYLNLKGVHQLPSRNICRAFFQIFFKHLYPYAPILHRQQLLDDYDSGNCSTFLIWSILAASVPYASAELLREAGFIEYSAAQKEFFSRARLLYDFGCEKEQLNLIQGSILLTSFQNSFAPDKDYRYWFRNAVRIATQLGFHRRNLGEEIDPLTHQLTRRIWWVLYCRDVWLSLVGFENTRQLHDGHLEIPMISDEDWAAEIVSSQQRDEILPEISSLQRNFMRENCQLSIHGGKLLDMFHPNQIPPTLEASQSFTSVLANWRSTLPPDLLLDRVDQWNSANALVLFLWALSFRLECSFYRTLRKRTRNTDPPLSSWAFTSLLRSIFELDTVLTRAFVNDVVHFLPASLNVCLSHLLAFQLEVALDSSARLSQRLAARSQISMALARLREVGSRTINARWTSRVFESVMKRKGFLIETDIEVPANDSTAGVGISDQNGLGQMVTHPALDPGLSQTPGIELADHWIEELLADNYFLTGPDDGFCSLLLP